jgi:hypothetical protein
MYDQAFTKAQLKRELKYRDFVKAKNKSSSYVGISIEEAEKLAKSGFDSSMTLSGSEVKGMKIFRPSDLKEELVVRKIATNISTLTRVHQSNRDQIVTELIRFLEENVSYVVYRLDISKFYESIPRANLYSRLSQDTALSRPTVRIVKSFFDQLDAKNISGLPRGISLSATLSELYMRGFDNSIVENPDVFYYRRFVDDIVIITSDQMKTSQALDFFERELPDGLTLNLDKQKHERILKGKDGAEHSLDYLGYSFLIKKPDAKDKINIVTIDISDRKVKKIKEKVASAFLAFIQDSDFTLLIDRIRYLTSNYEVLDVDRDEYLLAGIFYSYRNVTSDVSKALPSLDGFLKSIVCGSKGSLSKRLSSNITKNEKSRILGYSFEKGFNERVRYSVNFVRLEKILECWKYA